MPQRLSPEDIMSIVSQLEQNGKIDLDTLPYPEAFLPTDVFIAGSGPIGCGFARYIIENDTNATVFMADIGTQESSTIGHHQKNAIKYQKDIDAFVNVIKGALQPISVPPSEGFIPTLFGEGWTPPPGKPLVSHGLNPNQVSDFNLKSSAVTRVVGGMATHWTCACPRPHLDEREKNPIADLDKWLGDAEKILDVTTDQYDGSIRHTVVLETLKKKLGDRVKPLPLAVRRRKDNPIYVTWSGSDTVLGNKAVPSGRFTLSTETRVTQAIPFVNFPSKVAGVLIRDLKSDRDCFIWPRVVVIACGAVGTPQILHNSGICPKPLGRYLTEQSIAFCQIVLKKELIDAIPEDDRWKERVREHRERYPKDPLPIPFTDPEPQVTLPYSTDHPYHVQIHRDAFSYGDVGPRADSRVIVDLRFFGKQDIQEFNKVSFGPLRPMTLSPWRPGVTDIYGMPQATFDYRRSDKDNARDHKMMEDMCQIASALGSFLPGSNPQFMEPGLALHITGTTRIGTDPDTSVANRHSLVHGFENLWVGGNGCIPDSTACNPTLTSLAIALKAAKSIVNYLNGIENDD